ncbi:hypothetical protein [Methylobacterium sp. UNC378MF]|uniref:hypothetical protein n=1 Tax=Methylobacterium sp. UNC378MF TaxID=1502748 RepID=UPI00111467BB|nr:hypothetical protein [Methylobacterium sp. UNC378MF]
MSTTTIHQIACDNGRTCLTIHQRQDGLFFYTEDSFEGWDDTPAMWREGYPPSGLFTTAEEAKAEAEAVLPWLRATRI